MIHVIATIELHPGTRERFLEEFRRIVPEVRAETGCLEYGPTVDVDVTIARVPPPRGDVVTVIEKWEDAGALRAHLDAPHMKAYRERVKDLVAGAEIRVTRPV